MEHFHVYKNAILQAEQIANDLLGDYESLWAAANGKGFQKIGGAMIAPHLEGLDLRIANFTSHAKQAIQAVGEAFNAFYGLKSADGPVKNGNFNFARAFLAKQPTPSQNYLRLLEESKAGTNWIIRARNGFEHPGPDSLEIRNFEIREGTIIAPLWNFPSEKPTAILGGLSSLMNLLVQFAEQNFIFGFLDNVNVSLPMQIVPIPEDEINPECPICYCLDLVRQQAGGVGSG